MDALLEKPVVRPDRRWTPSVAELSGQYSVLRIAIAAERLDSAAAKSGMLRSAYGQNFATDFLPRKAYVKNVPGKGKVFIELHDRFEADSAAIVATLGELSDRDVDVVVEEFLRNL